MINNELNSAVSSAVSESKLCKMYRFVAGNRLAECSKLNIDMLEGIKSEMVGNNESLAVSVLYDALVIATGEKNEEIPVCLESSMFLAKQVGCEPYTVSFNEMEEYVLSALGIESSVEKCEGSKEEFEEEMGVEEVLKEEDEEEKEPQSQEQKQEENPTESKIASYYAQYTNGVIQELVKRYTSLFSSGYELVKPAGLLTGDGIIRVSGSSRSIKEDSVATSKMYEVFKSSLGFQEVETRSIAGVANSIYSSYISGGKQVLYFPNKLLEFAYGLQASDGDNQESLNTYKKHASANSWGTYCNTVLYKAVKVLVTKSTVFFVSKISEQYDNNYKDMRVVDALGNFLNYLQACLSLCILCVEYKTGEINGVHEVASFKVRVCDPEKHILNRDLTPDILQEAFMGGVGKVPFSYAPRVEEDTCIVEYSHEFNHSMAQATPLFAYKALSSLKEQGVELSFDSLILGMSEDGSILRGGTHGVNLTKHLTHNIIAGSQAGKGVMTLNILASGIASSKLIVYLDRKPDMASLFKYLAPNMPVINGGDIQQSYDSFNQWQGMSLDRVPDEVCEAFNCTPTWNDLGDLVYMRLLKLVIGLLMVRGSGHIEECFGGESGILLVVDEFSNFQRSYMSMVSNLTSILPPITIEKAQKALSEGRMTQQEYERVYNNAGYYALSYLNSMMADIEYLKVKKDAGYDPLETARSDIFVIGQTLERGMFNYEEFKETFTKSSASGRYKSVDARGITKGSFAIGEQSIPFNLVNFKTADAFFGRNMDDGRDKYLAQTNKSSKAYGRLDDKASNFAYLSSFSENTRKKIVHGSESENISMANKCVYFKPFLILNSSGMKDNCVLKMFDRVEKNAGISKEELIAENPSFNNPSIINEGVGFIDYIAQAGVNNVREILEKSSGVLNYIVSDILHYPGNWYQFCTDLSPEWLFTIRDIVEAVEQGNCGLYNPATNPVLQEYVGFNPDRFGGNFKDSTEESEEAMNSHFFDDATDEDFSDMNAMQRAEDARLSEAMGDFDSFNPDDEIDLSGDNSMYEPIKEHEINENIQDTGTQDEDDTAKRIKDLIKELSALGVNVEVGDTAEDTQFYQQAEKSTFGKEFEDIDYSEDINSLPTLMKVVTQNIINRFGGLERFNSFKVIGGSIVVNGYYYRCGIDKMFVRNIPYDIRRDINAGHVAKLFNYSIIKSMVNLRDLEIDSVDFAYDYVSNQLGYSKDSISIDRYFEDLKSLQVLTIGKKRFDRNNYIEQANGEDIFYKPKKVTQVADMSEYYLGKMIKGSWSFTKKMATNKNCNMAIKVLGTVGGAAATVTTGAVKVGTHGARKAIKLFKSGLKDLLNS